MKYLALGVLATVALAHVPVPAQASSYPTGATGKTNEKTKKSDKHTTNTTPVDPLSGPIGTDAQQGVADTKDKEQNVRVRALPAVSIVPASKGLIDYAPVLFGALLVVIGGLQWSVLKRQTKILEIQQRAFLTVNAKCETALVAGVVPKISIGISNVGPTPAYGLTANTWVEFLRDPFTQFSPQAATTNSDTVTVHPHDPLPIYFHLVLDSPLDENQIAKIKAERYKLCFRVLLKYRDVFGVSRQHGFAQFVELDGTTFQYLSKYNDGSS